MEPYEKYINQIGAIGNIEGAILSGQYSLDVVWGLRLALRIIKNTTLEDVAPVVHAYNKSKDSFLCSACTFGDFGLFNHGGKYTPNYCPNCGARMDEEQ